MEGRHVGLDFYDLLIEARKLAVLLHRLWVSGEVYEPLGYVASRTIVQPVAA